MFLRGGNWNNTDNTGAFTLNLNWTASNTNNNVGFRCASDQISARDGVVCVYGCVPGVQKITKFPLVPRQKRGTNIKPVFFFS